MEKFKNIFIDFDSTLNNLDQLWIDEINSYTGMTYSVLSIDSWDWFYKKFTKKLADLTLRNVYLKTKALDGAVEFILQCQTIANVNILTATSNMNPTFIERKNKHIRNLLGNVRIIHSTSKENYSSEDSVLIDDKLDNIYKFVMGGGYGIIFSNNETHVYNKAFTKHDRYVRLHNYDEIIEHLKKL